MDAMDLLTRQHRDVEQLLGEIAVSRGQERYALIEEVADIMAIHFELEEQVDPDGGAMRQLTKVTLAPELSVGTKFFDRPVLRIFGTFARWNDDAAANGVVLSDSNLSPFQHDRYGFTAGVQSEAWW